MQTFNLFNEYHLGDNIYTINFLNKYYNHNYIFNYYVNECYINELEKHIYNKNIILHSIYEKTSDAYNCWIGHNNYYYNSIAGYNNMYDIFYFEYFKKLSQDLQIENLMIDISDTLYHIYNLYEVNTIHDKYDYLIINSEPKSGQFKYDSNDFIKLTNHLIKNDKKIITTNKIDNVECTLDYNYNLLDVGIISNKCENIIAINTSPIITTFNNININTVNKRLILEKKLLYSYNNRIFNINDINNLYIHLC